MPPKLPAFPSTVPAYTRAVQDYMLRTDPRSGQLVESQQQAEQLGLKYSATFIYPNLQNYPHQTLAFLKYLDRIDARTSDTLATSQAKHYFGIAVETLNPLLAPLVELGFFEDTGPSRENIAAAFERWTVRKAEYKRITKAWQDAAQDPFADTEQRTAYSVEVAGPLYLGWYVDKPQQTTLDAATPVIIANMLGVAQQAMKDAWDQLGRDLTLADVRDKLRPDVWPAWLPWVAGGVGLLAVGGLAYAAVRATRPRARAGRSRAWTPAAYRRALVKGIAVESRKHPDFSPEMVEQLARDRLARDPYAYPLGNPHAVCGAAFGKLTDDERDAMPRSAFGLPNQRKYPMPDSSHAKNAKARARQQLAVWKRTNGASGLSPADYRRVVDKANKVIRECEGAAA